MCTPLIYFRLKLYCNTLILTMYERSNTTECLAVSQPQSLWWWFIHWYIDSYTLIGLVTLSPSGVVQVCSGQQLNLTCTTNERFLVWNFVPQLITNLGTSVMVEWLIASEDLTEQIQEITVNATSFSFRRTSAQHSSPLVSTVTIVNSSSALNMTSIRCTEVVGDGFELHRETAVSTIIQVTEDIKSETGI